MNDSIQYNLPGEWNMDQFIGELGGQHTIKKEPVKTETIRIYDTFDWRLYNKSLVLYQCGDKLSLRKLSGSEIMHSVKITASPVFIKAVPAGKLKAQLAPVIGVRALLMLAQIQSRTKPYALLDQQGKTVARLIHEEIRSSRSKDAPARSVHLWLQPVRGYLRQFQKTARRLEQAGLAANTEEDIYFKMLRTADKKPGSYSSKLTIRLEPGMRADEATKVILRFLLHVIRVNAAHIEKDIDTEFLHDFRVAVRRTRSALSQVRSVFALKTTDRFKKDFAFIGKLSNELRDIDVYLLKEDAYKAKIAPALRNDIQPLFDHLRQKRSEAFQKVIRGLKSKKYAKTVSDWETFLNTSPQDSPAAVNAKSFITTLARKIIHKKYRSVLKAGNRILASSDDEMLHALRIHCKKLRYLMEFFASLFPREKTDNLIGQLKRLQDNLGDFNDLRVQEEYLLAIAKEFCEGNGHSERIFLAIGSLVGALGRDRQMVKDAFADTFKDFASPANKELFKDLFAAQSFRSDP